MHIRALRGAALTLVALVGTVGLVLTASMTTLIQLAATALIMGGTGMKGAVEQAYMDEMNKTYLHLTPEELYGVATPEEFWPATGFSDISFDTSVARGVLALHNTIMNTVGHKIVLSYSQSANIATREKRNLEELRSQGYAGIPQWDELSFVFLANPNRPNGGILARFPGLYIPILGVTFDGATIDDGYQTIDVARQYDLISDFPKYPLNLLADLNALMGYFLLHPNYRSDVIDLDDPSTYESHTSGNTTYYLVHTEHLPLLQPLRDIGILTPVLDLIEPTLRVLIELGYDRTPENMGVPTRAGLMPHIDLGKLASDLHAAAREGVRNALAGLGITTDQHAESVAAPDKSDPEKVTLDTPVTAGPQSERTRSQLTRIRTAIENSALGQRDTDTSVKTDTVVETETETDTVADTAVDTVETDTSVKTTATTTTTTTAPEQKSKPEQLRQSLRRALSPEKASDELKVDASGDSPRPPRKAHRLDGRDSTRATSGPKDARNGTRQDKSRPHHRAGHSNAA